MSTRVFFIDAERDSLLLAEDRGQAADLGSQGGTDMLGCIGYQILNRSHYIIEENVSVHKSTESRYLTGDSSSDLGLVILQHLDESGHQVSRDDFFIDRFGDLPEDFISKT